MTNIGILMAGPSGGASLSFLAPGRSLAVRHAGAFDATLSGFGGTGVVDVTPVSFASAVASFAAGTLTVGAGTHSALFQFGGSYAPSGFHLAAGGHGRTAAGYG